MGGRFIGAGINPNAVGGKGFFGPGPKPPAAVGFVIQAGNGVYPGASGISAVTGWFGINDGSTGPQVIGSTVSGPSPFLPGGTFGFGDGIDAVRVPFVGPFFSFYFGGVLAQNSFASITINGLTYLTASVPYFDNGGGCGPTYFIWTAQPAGLVIGNAYPVTFG